jgi:hypothetical protein
MATAIKQAAERDQQVASAGRSSFELAPTRNTWFGSAITVEQLSEQASFERVQIK